MGSSKVKPDGWWSRRHRTSAEQDAAREEWERRKGVVTKRRRGVGPRKTATQVEGK